MTTWHPPTPSPKRRYARLDPRKKYRIVQVGLEGAGKTTAFYSWVKGCGTLTSSSIAIGHKLETFEFNNVSITGWAVGFPNEIRSLWQPYLENTQALIFVVDSADLQRMAKAKEELDRLMNDDRLRDTVLLVLANKQDLPNALSAEITAQQLGLHSLRQRRWHIVATSAVHPYGLDEALDWLTDRL